MNKLTLGILVSIVLLGGIIWVSYPGEEASTVKNPPNNSSNLALAAEHNSYDFGKISMKNGKVTHNFKIRNTSGANIDITRLYTSCMCTTASIKSLNGKMIGPYGMLGGHGGAIPYIKEVLEANAEAEVEVIFDPAAHGPAGIGRIDRLVIIENSGGSPLEMQISANVTP